MIQQITCNSIINTKIHIGYLYHTKKYAFLYFIPMYFISYTFCEKNAPNRKGHYRQVFLDFRRY